MSYGGGSGIRCEGGYFLPEVSFCETVVTTATELVSSIGLSFAGAGSAMQWMLPLPHKYRRDVCGCLLVTSALRLRRFAHTAS